MFNYIHINTFVASGYSANRANIKRGAVNWYCNILIPILNLGVCAIFLFLSDKMETKKLVDKENVKESWLGFCGVTAEIILFTSIVVIIFSRFPVSLFASTIGGMIFGIVWLFIEANIPDGDTKAKVYNSQKTKIVKIIVSILLFGCGVLGFFARPTKVKGWILFAAGMLALIFLVGGSSYQIYKAS